MSLRVHYPSPPTDETLGLLGSLSPECEVSGMVEGSLSYQALIEGRPTARQLDDSPDLRWVIVPFAGVPLTTLELVRERPQLELHNLHHNAAETAETAMALLLAAAKDLPHMDARLRLGDWSPRYPPIRTALLEGRRAVVLGYGEIGKRIARACLGLGMKVSAVKRSVDLASDGEVALHSVADLDSLLPQVNVLIIALPHTSETDGMIGPRRLAALPPNCVLVNVARAQIVDEGALYEALRDGRLHSAGLDVWYKYPEANGRQDGGVTTYTSMPDSAAATWPSTFPLWELPNIALSPHRGGASSETEPRRVRELARLLNAAASGEPMPNRVDVERGY